VIPRCLTRRLATLTFGLAALAAALAPASASATVAPSPWWHLTTLSSPSGPQQITVATAANGTSTENERQTVTFDPFVTGGAFTLAFEGEATGPIAFDASSAEIAAALEGLSRLGSGSLAISGSAGGPWTIEFAGSLADTNVPQLTSDASGLSGESEITVVATNLGDAPGRFGSEMIDEAQPLVLQDTLPPGVEATRVIPYGGGSNLGNNRQREHATCSQSGQTLTCSYPVQVKPYEDLVLDVYVKVAPGAGEGANEVTLSGGPAPELTQPETLHLEEAPSFGLTGLQLSAEEDGGSMASRAASHPFQLTTTVFERTRTVPDFNSTRTPPANLEVQPLSLTKDAVFKLPAGLVGNARSMPRCPEQVFAKEVAKVAGFHCPLASVLGVATTITALKLGGEYPYLESQPLYNLVPAHGEPARFGFSDPSPVPVILDTAVRSSGDYGLTVSSRDITQLVALIGAQTTFWGWPADPRHDAQRGTCVNKGETAEVFSCPLTEVPPPAYLSLPATCEGPLSTTAEVDPWSEPGSFASLLSDPPIETLQACNQVPFKPELSAEPTSDAATSPTGLGVDLDVHDEGLANPAGIAQSEVKKTVVTLPEGFTTNPSVAAGLGACSQAAYESTTLNEEPGTGCPNDSKIGDLEVESPLVSQKLTGSLYVAKQKENPFGTLLALYMVAREPEIGVLIKAAGKVEANPVTGQLTTTFDNLPQLPFSHFHLSFRQGQRSPLITPPACGAYAIKALLYPWSEPNVPLPDESSFQITAGPEGEGCPSGGVPPFHPGLVAGSLNNAAGHYTPFYIRLSRHDSEQEITHFSIKLPPGVVGKLAGIPLCSDAQVAQAKSREHEGGGGEEEAGPSCPAASEVGHTLVETGVGTVLAQAPGRVYLAGPYHGSAISVVAITDAKVGPFDLGTVVVREALRVNPETGEVFVDATGSDPIPHIVDGIPTHLRDIRVYMDKPEFVLNPTSCKQTSTASTVLGSGLSFASEADDQPITVTSPFQAADCAALGFKPKLKLSLIGGTKRGQNPKLRAVLTARAGDANIGRAQVTLPRSEFLDNAHIKTICTRTEFAQGNVPGEQCPAGSVYGFAKAITPILSEPLQGPVYLRSSEHKLPDLVAALHSGEINIALDGRIDSVKGQIRNTFETVPDAPVKTFTLEMQGAKKGLLENSTDLCAATHRAIADFTGHNGKVEDFRPALKPLGCGKAGKGHKGHKHKRPSR
jgi:hypothetical protein